MNVLTVLFRLNIILWLGEDELKYYTAEKDLKMFDVTKRDPPSPYFMAVINESS